MSRDRGGHTRFPYPTQKQMPETSEASRRVDAELQARRIIRRPGKTHRRTPGACAFRVAPHLCQPSRKRWTCCERTSELPDFREYAVDVKVPGAEYEQPTDVLAHFLAEVMRRNMSSFRVFGPDETASNRLQAIYEASKKTWLAEFIPQDADGGELDVAGRVMEMLSEHTLEGWFEGYVLTGRHGFFSSYEAFIHIIDSMFNQHAKWLEKSKKELNWRAPVPSINILITSVVWRQDHNGFTHEDPGFLDIVTNKSPDVGRIYFYPPDANCLLSVTDHCLRSRDYISSVIVADKQEHLQYLTMEDAVTHRTKGHRHLGLGLER